MFTTVPSAQLSVLYVLLLPFKLSSHPILLSCSYLVDILSPILTLPALALIQTPITSNWDYCCLPNWAPGLYSVLTQLALPTIAEVIV